MNIVIYDNHIDYQSLLEKRIDERIRDQVFDLNVFKYSRKFDLLTHLADCIYHFAFIEMTVDHYHGIEIAKALKRVNPNCRFIFMCHQELRADEAFQIGAMSYLLKPLSITKLNSILDSIKEWYFKQNIKFILSIKDHHFVKRCFCIDDICYIKTSYNTLEIVTMKNEHIFSPIKNVVMLRNILRPRWFIEINCSLLINMKSIHHLVGNDVILKNNEVFGISRFRLKNTRSTYKQFIIESYKTPCI